MVSDSVFRLNCFVIVFLSYSGCMYFDISKLQFFVVVIFPRSDNGNKVVVEIFEKYLGKNCDLANMSDTVLLPSCVLTQSLNQTVYAC